LGYNYRMTDIQAAVGREQLKRLSEIIERRRFLAERYGKLLVNVPGIGLPEESPWARSNWQSYCVRLPNKCDQQKVMQFMLDQNVATRRGIMCAHREPAYTYERWACGGRPGTCDCPSGTCTRLIESERAQDTGLILPLYHQMTETEQETVVTALRKALNI
jgi:dTDP-4-amino-4,6-dideoxygalactose transaminase